MLGFYYVKVFFYNVCSVLEQIKVDVEISECDVDEHGNEIYRDSSSETSSAARITAPRDTPRGHLQRLGALYADKDISSPIHRNEDRFHEGFSESSKPRTKFTRLAALASEINSWEDDPSHPDYKHHRKTINANANSESPRKKAAPLPPTSSPTKKPLISPKKPIVSPRRVITDSSSQNARQQKEDERTKSGAGTKNLQWDTKVMSHLELQGFKRRDTTHQRLVYEYDDEKRNEEVKELTKKTRAPDVPDTKQVTSHIEGREMPKEKKQFGGPSTSKGVVQGHAAIFDKPKRKSIMGKDPTELSLKVSFLLLLILS